MISTALLALLVGAATALPRVAQYEKSWTPYDTDKFAFTARFDGDMGYKTGYEAAEGDDQHKERYGLEIYSYANFTVKMEYFRTYYHEYTFSFIPFDIYPYKQEVAVTRPESNEAKEQSTKGYYSIAVAHFETTVRENTKTCGASVVDYAMGTTDTLKPTCEYDMEKEVEYVDPYWKYAPFQDQSWYGEHEWWTYTHN